MPTRNADNGAPQQESSPETTARRIELPLIDLEPPTNPAATERFIAMVGSHLGNDREAYAKFLSGIRDELLAGADVNAPHRTDRLGPGTPEQYACHADGRLTATDLYVTLERIYLDLAVRERTSEELDAANEGINTDRQAFCTRMVELLRSFGGQTAQELGR